MGNKDDVVKLLTIQHEKAFDNFEESKILKADNDYIWAGDEMRYAYDYMHDEMVKRIGKPLTKDIKYPIWAYYCWEGLRKKPDLRLSGYHDRNTPLVLIEFEAQKKDIVLSDFDYWCYVLSWAYIQENETDLDAFYNKYENIRDRALDLFYKNETITDPIILKMKKEIVESWSKVFDVRYDDENKSIQATTWQVNMNQVKKIKKFIAK